MTIDTIETVQEGIAELLEEGISISGVWEYTNTMSNEKMFAIFTSHEFCDMHCSPTVKDPILIWAFGRFLDNYAHLN